MRRVSTRGPLRVWLVSHSVLSSAAPESLRLQARCEDGIRHGHTRSPPNRLPPRHSHRCSIRHPCRTDNDRPHSCIYDVSSTPNKPPFTCSGNCTFPAGVLAIILRERDLTIHRLASKPSSAFTFRQSSSKRSTRALLRTPFPIQRCSYE